MEDAADPEALAGRIDALLGELRGDARSRAVAEQLVRSLMQFYGAAFERTLDVVATTARPVIDTLAADPLVGSVMLLHDLHPLDHDRRVADALERARAAVDDAGVTVSLVASDEGRLRIRLSGAPPSDAARYRAAAVRALREALPEIGDIDVDDPPAATVAPLPLCRPDGTPMPIPRVPKRSPAIPEERTGA